MIVQLGLAQAADQVTQVGVIELADVIGCHVEHAGRFRVGFAWGCFAVALDLQHSECAPSDLDSHIFIGRSLEERGARQS
ncbi:MAG: hypothetical protein AMXMBFR76_18390 [Pseudomonadota bacterium]